MSRGLGSKQRLLLDAIRSIEQEDGAGPIAGRHWRISYILERAYSLSSELQDIERHRADAIAADKARIAKLASEGDEKAKLFLSLTRALAKGPRWEVGERFKRQSPEWIEYYLNPSRTLALLAKRGLITRIHGGAALTDAGREMLKS